MADGMGSELASCHVHQRRHFSGRIPITIEQIDYSRGEVIDPPGSDLVLCLVQKGSGQVRSRFGAGKARVHNLHSGLFVPITLPAMEAEFAMGAPMRHLTLTLPAHVFEPWDGAQNGSSLEHLAVLQETAFAQPLVQQIMLAIADLAGCDEVSRSLMLDSLLSSLAGSLVQKAGQASDRSAPVRLSPREVARVTAYMRSRLHEAVALKDLAQLLELPERVTLEAFKGATGQSPHQFLIALRIEAAKEMLSLSDRSLIDIAAAAGFADQAHFTATFSRRVGVSPARFRRNRRF